MTLLLEGAYLYYDKKPDASFVRSGKVNGRPLKNRDDEHEANARKGLGSKFHRTYPDRNAVNKSPQRRGHFQDLELFCGLLFSRTKNDNHYKMLLKSAGDGGIFLWNRECLGQLEKMNFEKSLEEKQLHMVGYLCELFLDLCICPAKNVSTSASIGFESVCR